MKRAQHRATVLPHLAAAVGAALTLLAPHPAFSQTDDAATLADFRACGALQRDSARLACFDGVLAADRSGGGVDESAEVEPDEPEVSVAAAESPETPGAPEPEPEPAGILPVPDTPQPEPAQAVAAAEAQSEPIEEQAAIDSPAEPVQAQVASAPREEPREAQTASVVESRPAEPPTANEASAAAERTQAAAIAVRDEAADAASLTIVEMRTRIPGAARFVSDDGRVFVQTSGGSNYRNFPDAPFPATLEDGALGSTFLRLGPRLRVRVRTLE